MIEEDGKTPLQASGEDRPESQIGSTQGGGKKERSGGESQGGAYPNPHTSKEDAGESEGFHGGQSKTAYHGTGQLGEQDVDGQQNVNSPDKG